MIDAKYIDKLNARIRDLETELSQPEVSANTKRFQELLTEHAHQKKMLGKVASYFELARRKAENEELLNEPDADEELKELAREELEEVDAQLPEAEKAMRISLLTPDPREKKNTIVEIRAGTGGEEAALFAADLFRMYQRFADLNGWQIEVLEQNASDIGGFKEIIFAVNGDEVFRRLQFESGVHRVQRVPHTEASGRVHTSAATVAVLPEAEEVDIKIKPEELRIDVTRSSGPGGQSVNTTDSAVRITHLPTNTVVQCQDEKSQHRNREKAMVVLRARLLDKKQQEEHSKMADTRRSQIGTGDRSERIRTYNFPQNRMSDHRINLTLHSLDKIMEGELNELVDALYENDLEHRLKEHLEA